MKPPKQSRSRTIIVHDCWTLQHCSPQHFMPRLGNDQTSENPIAAPALNETTHSIVGPSSEAKQKTRLDILLSAKCGKATVNLQYAKIRSTPILRGETKVNRIAVVIVLASFLLAASVSRSTGDTVPEFRDLFNGKDLTGWVNVNTVEDTWKVRDGVLICSGHPIGVMRSEKQYENFVLHIEWMHIEPGGNSGVFVWSRARPNLESRLPDGVEVQMLELDWVKLNKVNGLTPPDAYVHGELFGVGGVRTVPDNPRGERSKSIENRCKGRGEWNTYDVVAVDGVIKLSVNSKFVNGISRTTQKRGYLCLESEGAEIHFRNIKIMELPPGVTAPGLK